MTKRVFWKRGMRLTDEVLRMSDSYHAEFAGRAFLLATAGRFGLLPSTRHFRVSLDFNKNVLQVTSLDCLGLTRGGQLVDISFDSHFSQPGDTHVVLPSSGDDQALLLLVRSTGEWRDAGDGSCEPVWQFSLITENTPVRDDALPLARIVKDPEWRSDDQFVPPCLFLTSHDRYMELCNDFRSFLDRLEMLVPAKLVTDSGDARKIFLPEVRRLRIVMDKEAELMAPMSLFARVQECVSAFHCACTLDECLTLSEADKYEEYVRRSYHFKDCASRIREGLELVGEIVDKVERFEAEQPSEPEPAVVPSPYIQNSDLHVFATSNDVRVEVFGLDPGTAGFYSIDGSDPSKPLQGGRYVPVNPGFNKTHTVEDDKTYQVKLKAVSNGRSSKVTTFSLVVTKDVNVWKGFQI